MHLSMAGAVELVVGILGIIAALAAAAAMFKSSYIKAQLDGLRGDRDDQAARIDRLESEVKRLIRENEDLRTKNAVLEKLARGDDRLVRIENTVQAILLKVTQ